MSQSLYQVVLALLLFVFDRGSAFQEGLWRLMQIYRYTSP